jgi:hypothetical protein
LETKESYLQHPSSGAQNLQHQGSLVDHHPRRVRSDHAQHHHARAEVAARAICRRPVTACAQNECVLLRDVGRAGVKDKVRACVCVRERQRQKQRERKRVNVRARAQVAVFPVFL